jgi:hypothetical protein
MMTILWGLFSNTPFVCKLVHVTNIVATIERLETSELVENLFK